MKKDGRRLLRIGSETRILSTFTSFSPSFTSSVLNFLSLGLLFEHCISSSAELTASVRLILFLQWKGFGFHADDFSCY